MKTIHKHILWLGLTALALSLNACYYDVSEPVIETGPMSFANDIIPIFNASCNTAGCHSGNVAPNLSAATAYNALSSGNYLNTANPENSELYQWMSGNRSMPMPLSGPNAAYNAKVLAWIRQGALNN